MRRLRSRSRSTAQDGRGSLEEACSSKDAQATGGKATGGTGELTEQSKQSLDPQSLNELSIVQSSESFDKQGKKVSTRSKRNSLTKDSTSVKKEISSTFKKQKNESGKLYKAGRDSDPKNNEENSSGFRELRTRKSKTVQSQENKPEESLVKEKKGKKKPEAVGRGDEKLSKDGQILNETFCEDGCDRPHETPSSSKDLKTVSEPKVDQDSPLSFESIAPDRRDVNMTRTEGRKRDREDGVEQGREQLIQTLEPPTLAPSDVEMATPVSSDEKSGTVHALGNLPQSPSACNDKCVKIPLTKVRKMGRKALSGKEFNSESPSGEEVKNNKKKINRKKRRRRVRMQIEARTKPGERKKTLLPTQQSIGTPPGMCDTAKPGHSFSAPNTITESRIPQTALLCKGIDPATHRNQSEESAEEPFTTITQEDISALPQSTDDVAEELPCELQGDNHLNVSSDHCEGSMVQRVPELDSVSTPVEEIKSVTIQNDREGDIISSNESTTLIQTKQSPNHPEVIFTTAADSDSSERKKSQVSLSEGESRCVHTALEDVNRARPGDNMGESNVPGSTAATELPSASEPQRTTTSSSEVAAIISSTVSSDILINSDRVSRGDDENARHDWRTNDGKDKQSSSGGKKWNLRTMLLECAATNVPPEVGSRQQGWTSISNTTVKKLLLKMEINVQPGGRDQVIAGIKPITLPTSEPINTDESSSVSTQLASNNSPSAPEVISPQSHDGSHSLEGRGTVLQNCTAVQTAINSEDSSSLVISNFFPVSDSLAVELSDSESVTHVLPSTASNIGNTSEVMLQRKEEVILERNENSLLNDVESAKGNRNISDPPEVSQPIKCKRNGDWPPLQLASPVVGAGEESKPFFTVNSSAPMPPVGIVVNVQAGQPLSPHKASHICHLLDKCAGTCVGLSSKMAYFCTSVVHKRGDAPLAKTFVFPVEHPKWVKAMEQKWQSSALVSVKELLPFNHIPRLGGSGNYKQHNVMPMGSSVPSLASNKLTCTKPVQEVCVMPCEGVSSTRGVASCSVPGDMDTKRWTEESDTDHKGSISPERNEIPICDEDLAEVASLIGRMVDFVVRKEEVLEIPYDPDRMSTSDNAEPLKPMKKKVTLAKGNRTLMHEMRRLNVNFLDVPNRIGSCNLEHCRLGCVCESIHTHFVAEHCGKEKCMFACSCTALRKTSDENDESDLIHKVMWMQGDTKKKLAKEERNFQQTVVCSRDGVSVVSRKRRREIKLPERYRQDFYTPSTDPYIFETPRNRSGGKAVSPTKPSESGVNVSQAKDSHPANRVSLITPVVEPSKELILNLESAEKISLAEPTGGATSESTFNLQLLDKVVKAEPMELIIKSEPMEEEFEICIKSEPTEEIIETKPRFDRDEAEGSCLRIATVQSLKPEMWDASDWNTNSSEVTLLIANERLKMSDDIYGNREKFDFSPPQRDIKLIRCTTLKAMFDLGEAFVWFNIRSKVRAKVYLTETPTVPCENCVGIHDVDRNIYPELPLQLDILLKDFLIFSEDDEVPFWVLQFKDRKWMISGFMEQSRRNAEGVVQAAASGTRSMSGILQLGDLHPSLDLPERIKKTHTLESLDSHPSPDLPERIKTTHALESLGSHPSPPCRWWLIALSTRFEVAFFPDFRVGVTRSQMCTTAILSNQENPGMQFHRLMLPRDKMKAGATFQGNFGVYGLPGLSSYAIFGPYGMTQKPAFGIYKRESTTSGNRYNRVPVYCGCPEGFAEMDPQGNLSPQRVDAPPSECVWGYWLVDSGSSYSVIGGELTDGAVLGTSDKDASSEDKLPVYLKTSADESGNDLVTHLKTLRRGISLVRDNVDRSSKDNQCELDYEAGDTLRSTSSLEFKHQGTSEERLHQLSDRGSSPDMEIIQIPDENNCVTNKVDKNSSSNSHCTQPAAPPGLDTRRASSTSKRKRITVAESNSVVDERALKENRKRQREVQPRTQSQSLRSLRASQTFQPAAVLSGKVYLVPDIMGLGYLTLTKMECGTLRVDEGPSGFLQYHDSLQSLCKLLDCLIIKMVPQISNLSVKLNWRLVTNKDECSGHSPFNSRVLGGYYVMLPGRVVDLRTLDPESISNLGLPVWAQSELVNRVAGALMENEDNDSQELRYHANQLAVLVGSQERATMSVNEIANTAHTVISNLHKEEKELKNSKEQIKVRQKEIIIEMTCKFDDIPREFAQKCKTDALDILSKHRKLSSRVSSLPVINHQLIEEVEECVEGSDPPPGSANESLHSGPDSPDVDLNMDEERVEEGHVDNPSVSKPTPSPAVEVDDCDPSEIDIPTPSSLKQQHRHSNKMKGLVLSMSPFTRMNFTIEEDGIKPSTSPLATASKVSGIFKISLPVPSTSSVLDNEMESKSLPTAKSCSADSGIKESDTGRIVSPDHLSKPKRSISSPTTIPVSASCSTPAIKLPDPTACLPVNESLSESLPRTSHQFFFGCKASGIRGAISVNKPVGNGNGVAKLTGLRSKKPVIVSQEILRSAIAYKRNYQRLSGMGLCRSVLEISPMKLPSKLIPSTLNDDRISPSVKRDLLARLSSSEIKRLSCGITSVVSMESNVDSQGNAVENVVHVDTSSTTAGAARTTSESPSIPVLHVDSCDPCPPAYAVCSIAVPLSSPKCAPNSSRDVATPLPERASASGKPATVEGVCGAVNPEAVPNLSTVGVAGNSAGPECPGAQEKSQRNPGLRFKFESKLVPSPFRRLPLPSTVGPDLTGIGSEEACTSLGASSCSSVFTEEKNESSQ